MNDEKMLPDESSEEKNEFIGSVDLDMLKKELAMPLEEIAALSGLKNPKGVYNWNKPKSKNGTRPSYNAIVKMLESGASTNSLFGVKTISVEKTDAVKVVAEGLRQILAAIDSAK